MHNAGAADVAFDLASESPAIRQALGTPIHQTGPALGETRVQKENGGYSQGVMPVAGPKGQARLCFVGNRTSSGWDIEAEELFRSGEPAAIDLTPPVRRENLHLPVYGSVYLVPLGPRVAPLLARLPAYYQAKLGIQVTVLPAVVPPESVRDPSTRESIADSLIAFIERSHPRLAADPQATLIGVTAGDMENSRHWKHGLNFRENPDAVISLWPIEPGSSASRANPLVLPVRLRKVVTKNIGLLIYPLTVSASPTSVLYATRGTASDIDMMGENFRNAAGRWVPKWVPLGPGVDITRSGDGSVTWRPGFEESTPRDTQAESWQTSLGNGLFVQAQTDFADTEPHSFPFVRVYRPRDNWSRSFGIGTSDSFDRLLVGVYGKWCDEVMDDGTRIHFRRNWWKPFSEEYLLDMGNGLSRYAVLRYNGRIWHLKTSEGWTYVFPNGYAGHRPQQAAMIGMSDPQGRSFQMQRDAEGNLLQVTSPAGYRIDFQYDGKGRIVEATDNRGRTVRYKYDPEGRLVHVQDSSGRIESYVYDGRDDMTRVEDGSGRPLLINQYDAAGWIVRQQLPGGRTFRYRYRRDAQGNLQSVRFVGPQGYVIEYQMSDCCTYRQDWPVRMQASGQSSGK